jgi:hypothetical protein
VKALFFEEEDMFVSIASFYMTKGFYFFENFVHGTKDG